MKIRVVARLLLVLAACQWTADLPGQSSASPTTSQPTPTVPATPPPAESVLRAAPVKTQTASLPVSVTPGKPTPGTPSVPTEEPEPVPTVFGGSVWITDSVDEMPAALDKRRHPEEPPVPMLPQGVARLTRPQEQLQHFGLQLFCHPIVR